MRLPRLSEENHPELWLRFAEGIGATRNIKDQPELESTKALVDGYYDLVKSDYATGLGALYAYERQATAVSKSKIDGLKCNYGVSDPETLKFFTVHQGADESISKSYITGFVIILSMNLTNTFWETL